MNARWSGGERTSTARPSTNLDRRHFLAGALTLGTAIAVTWELTSPPTAGSTNRIDQPSIRPRSDWAQGHGPTGTIQTEDPRFLLVHHTASPGNDYAPEDVPALIRSMYWYHTGDDKGWPDVAYNFLVDQFGTIWEGRSGSLAGPVRGSATGGNQGFSQLCCFIGNLDAQDPSTPATGAMVELLAWLATERSIDVSSGATTTFTSLGSNKWPAGTAITTPTIAGHRDMSQTSCPGDRGYAFVTGTLPGLIQTKLGMTSDNATPETTTTQDPISAEANTSSTTATTTQEAQAATSDPRLGSSSTTASSTTALPPTSPPPNNKDTATTMQERESAISAQSTGDSHNTSGSRKWVPFAVGAGIAATLQGAAIISRSKGRSGSLGEDPVDQDPPSSTNH